MTGRAKLGSVKERSTRSLDSVVKSKVCHAASFCNNYACRAACDNSSTKQSDNTVGFVGIPTAAQ